MFCMAFEFPLPLENGHFNGPHDPYVHISISYKDRNIHKITLDPNLFKTQRLRQVIDTDIFLQNTKANQTLSPNTVHNILGPSIFKAAPMVAEVGILILKMSTNVSCIFLFIKEAATKIGVLQLHCGSQCFPAIGYGLG